MKHICLDDIIGVASVIGLLVSFIMLIGIAGAIDCDTLTFADGIKKMVVWFIVFICSAIGIIHVEKEEDSYDRL